MERIEYTLVHLSPLIKKVEKILPLIDENKSFPDTIGAMVWSNNEIHVRGVASIAPDLLNHELIHLAQIKNFKGGFKEYLYKYFVEDQDIPYHKKEVEVEAYQNQYDMNYIQNKYGIDFVLGKEIWGRQYDEKNNK